MTDSFDLGLNVEDLELPRYIAVEGPIGVGKTTLVKNLAKTFGYDTLLEQADDNPFLERFYRDPKSSALPTQLFFLFQRAQQIQDLRQSDLFQSCRVADFLMDKDQLFAQTCLDEDEFSLYLQVFEKMTIDVPQPDLVIYLQASNSVLHERIRHRGIPFEQQISTEYLDALNDAYMHFFHYYNRAPLLIVNASDLDLANNEKHYRQLVNYILTIKSGRHFYNPTPQI